MSITSLEEGLHTRLEELKELWEDVYKKNVPFTHSYRHLVDDYLTTIPVHLQSGRGYEAVFFLTRVATMLGEIRIECKPVNADKKCEEQSGINEGSPAESTAEEAYSNICPIK